MVSGNKLPTMHDPVAKTTFSNSAHPGIEQILLAN